MVFLSNRRVVKTGSVMSSCRSTIVPISQLFLSLFLAVSSVNGECNVCQSNQAACINSTSFYLCFGETTPNTDKLYHCLDGFDCTDVAAICTQSSNTRPPSCGDTSLCGQCHAHRNYLFSCLSRRTFQMCYGALRPTGQIGSCPEGTLCVADSDAICVPETEVESPTCDTFDPDPTPNPTTPDPPADGPNAVCQQVKQIGLFLTQPPDPTCKRYVYCYYSNGIIQGLEYSCSASSFYNDEMKACSFARPPNCL